MPIGPDPIYAVIEQHRKAAREHTEAIDLEAASEEAGGFKDERREEYERLSAHRRRAPRLPDPLRAFKKIASKPIRKVELKLF